MPDEPSPRQPRDSTVRFTGTRSRLARIILISILVGVLSGLAAKIMETALEHSIPHVIGAVSKPASQTIFHFDWRILALPAAGGLLAGLVLMFFRRERAHGTAYLINAFHNERGEMSLMESLFKAAAAIIVIVMGCSVGKEAAIAVLGAAIGASLAGALRMNPRERRMFLVAGCAAGVGAIFQCPLGGALFAVTVLYREPDIEVDSLLPSIISSVVAYSTFMAFGGFGRRLLTLPENVNFTSPIELPVYALLGVLCAGAGIFFYYCLRLSNELFHRAKIPRWLAPAVAGLLGGGIAVAFPQVMDAGYDFLRNSLDRSWFGGDPDWVRWALLFAIVAVAKCVATALMIGSDSPGGLFGPVVFIGGAVGALTGGFLEAFLPDMFPEYLREALIPVGMAGMIAASLRVPLASMVMVMEMTGSYALIVPLMLTSVIAYMIGRRWGIYPHQVVGLEASPAHAGESVVSILETWKVGDLMDTNWPHIANPGTSVKEMVSQMTAGTRPYFAILRDKQLVGLVSTGDVARASEMMGPTDIVIAADIMTAYPLLVHPNQDLYGTLETFRKHNLEVLPVVDPEDGTFLGMLGRGAIMQALRDRVARERTMMLREHTGMELLDQEGQLQEMLTQIGPTGKGTVLRMEVPDAVVGKSLAEASFRREYGEVIAIQTADGDLLAPPDPTRPLQKNDHLVLLPMNAPKK